MDDSPEYLLDANVFIEAARHYYAFDLAPIFWENLIRHLAEGDVYSIDRVKTELMRGHDQLSEWARDEFADGFISTDEVEIIDRFRHVMAWVQSQDQFLEAAKADFANGADGWLVAYAIENNCIIVTHEAYTPDARAKVRIPNVCEALNVEYTDTFNMLRALGIRFD